MAVYHGECYRGKYGKRENFTLKLKLFHKIYIIEKNINTMVKKNNLIEEIKEIVQQIKDNYQEGVDFKIPY
jgi:uncharacterized protein YeeX (DUF496 family)